MNGLPEKAPRFKPVDVAALKRERTRNMQGFILKLANQDHEAEEQFAAFGDIPDSVLRGLAQTQFSRSSAFANMQPAVTGEYRDLIFTTLRDRRDARRHAGSLMHGLDSDDVEAELEAIRAGTSEPKTSPSPEDEFPF